MVEDVVSSGIDHVDRVGMRSRLSWLSLNGEKKKGKKGKN